MLIRAIGSACEQPVLLGPVERQIEFGQTRRGELDGLAALQDGLDQLRAQKGKIDEASDITSRDAVAKGELLERSYVAGRSSARA